MEKNTLIAILSRVSIKKIIFIFKISRRAGWMVDGGWSDSLRLGLRIYTPRSRS